MVLDNGITMTAKSKTTKQKFKTQAANNSPHSSGNYKDIK